MTNLFVDIQRNVVNEQFGGSVSLTEPFYKEYQLMFEAYSSLVYFVAILYMARGSLIKGYALLCSNDTLLEILLTL
jgi:hypothetical protein